MEINHNPVINHRPDGRWEVTCPECLMLRDSGVDVPVGIGLVMRSWESALRIWTNHLGPVGDSLDTRAQPVVTSSPPLQH
jgi:hypothetical protein